MAIMENSGRKKETWLNFLSGNRLAIYSLIALALLTLLGTIIPQRGPGLTELQYHTLVESGGFWSLADHFGLLDIFRSPWFIGAFTILTLNMILCTWIRFERVLKSRTPKDLVPNDALMNTMSSKIPFNAKKSVEGSVRQLMRIRNEKSENGVTWLYSESGDSHRFGAIVTHIGILVAAVGALIGIAIGVEGNMMIGEGEAEDQVQYRVGNSGFNLPFSVRCDDFTVEFYEDGNQPKTFRSDLTFTPNDGSAPQQQTVEVNKPGKFGKYRFFQSTYGTLPPQATIKIRGSSDNKLLATVKATPNRPMKLPGDVGMFALADVSPNKFNSGLAVLIVEGLENADPTEFWVFQKNADFDKSRGGRFIYELTGIDQGSHYTGLQVAWNPGVNVVWLGSGLTMLGILLAFFVRHRRILVRIEGDRVMIGGRHSLGAEESLEYVNEFVKKLGKQSTDR
jgi:cytochrome c biogenesis protein